jgi:hypothetical protein
MKTVSSFEILVYPENFTVHAFWVHQKNKKCPIFTQRPLPPSQQLPTRFIQTFVRSDLADDSGRPPLSACLPGISKICHSN